MEALEENIGVLEAPEYETPEIEDYEEDDAWTFAPCGQD